jgi:hypothetical protein
VPPFVNGECAGFAWKKGKRECSEIGLREMNREWCPHEKIYCIFAIGAWCSKAGPCNRRMSKVRKVFCGKCKHFCEVQFFGSPKRERCLHDNAFIRADTYLEKDAIVSTDTPEERNSQNDCPDFEKKDD